MTKPATRGPDIKFYLVGRVPVQITQRADGGVDVQAFNPLLGGFVEDARYYGAVQFEDMGRVQQINRARFDTAVADLREEFGQTA